MKHIPSILTRSQVNKAEIDSISDVPHIRQNIRNNTKNKSIFRREPNSMSMYLHTPANIEDQVLRESSVLRYMYFPRYIQ